MARLISHIIGYAAVNAFLIAVWLLTDGSISELQAIGQDPTKSMGAGFWPIWPILSWGTLVIIHAGLTLSNLASGSRSVRRRRRMARQATRTGRDIAREVGGVIDRAAQRRADREERRGARGAENAAVQAMPGPPVAAAPPVSTSSRKWVTVLFSDIADSTKLNEDLGDEEWHRLLGRVRGIVRGAVTERGGSEVGSQGDGTLARFESPADAVLCAIDIQSGLTSAGASGEFVPSVRIGVHAGDAVEDEGDLIGRVINLASRVKDEAEPGEILVTEPVADQLVGKMELEDKGLRPLKGVAQPRHLLAVKWGDADQT